MPELLAGMLLLPFSRQWQHLFCQGWNWKVPTEIKELKDFPYGGEGAQGQAVLNLFRRSRLTDFAGGIKIVKLSCPLLQHGRA